MKAIRILIISIIVMAVLASCGIEDNGAINNNNAAQPAESNNTIVSKEVSFTAHYYKFNQVKDLIGESPGLSKVKIIESRKALDTMEIEIQHTPFDQTEFESLINSYTDEWFESHQLLAFGTLEASGSYALNVKQVINGPNAKIVIERWVPDGAHTDDIGSWIVLIETDNVFTDGQDFTLEFYEVKKPYEELNKRN